VDNRSKVVAT